MRKTSSKTLKQVILKRSNDYSQLEQEYGYETGAPLLDPNRLPPNVTSGKPLTISVVIPAYNVQSSIFPCLAAIEQSSFNVKYQDRLQVIVIDDGSTDNTWSIIKASRLSLHLTALRQTNHGQAQALNTGISIAEGDIIISCDSDMVLGYYAIEHFVTCHQQIPNALFAGFRLDTPKNDPRVDVNFIKQNGSHTESCFKNDERIVFQIPGWPSNMCLASEHFKSLGQGRSLWMPDNDAWLLPDLVFGALFSLSRSVFIATGGYDERFLGWGCTDGYLAAKAIGAGNYVIPLYAASGLHISHPVRLENKQLQYERNRELFLKLIQTTKVDNHPDWLTNAKKRIIESFVRNPQKRSLSFRSYNYLCKKTDLSLNEIDNLLAIGKYCQALAAISKRNIEKNNWKTYLNLGKAFAGMNLYKEAIDILSKVASSTNLLSDVTLELAMIQAANGQFESAKKTLNRLAQVHYEAINLSYWFTISARDHITRGRKYLSQGFCHVALRCFEAALIGDPHNNEALKLRNQIGQNLSLF